MAQLLKKEIKIIILNYYPSTSFECNCFPPYVVCIKGLDVYYLYVFVYGSLTDFAISVH